MCRVQLAVANHQLSFGRWPRQLRRHGNRYCS